MAKKKNNRKKMQQKQEAATPEKRSSLPWILAAVCIIAAIFAAILWARGKAAKADNGITPSTETAAAAQDDEQQTAREQLESGVTYFADIMIENYGTITVQLDADEAPITVLNFVSLAGSGFYDGLTFHRIISGFMIQGGDPLGNGMGGSDNTITGEFTNNGYQNTLSHTRGAISMARSSDYNSASSQFFIVQEDSTYLDGDYAVFGYVTDGMDVVDAICEDAEPTDGNGTISADHQPVIQAIVIRTEPAE